jgi:hypothetical protein
MTGVVFVLFNIVIGVVINSIEEAREDARRTAAALECAERAERADAQAQTLRRLDAPQEAIDDLRSHVESNGGPDGGGPRNRAASGRG